MLTATHPTSSRTSFILLLALLLCAGLFSRLCYLVRPFDSDGAMFIYMGRLISEGGRFGHDIVDNKFPTVGLMTSLPWRCFGPNWGPYVALGATMSLVASLVLYRAARRSFGEDAGRATLLAAVVYLNFNTAVFGGFQLETPQALFASLATAAALEALRREDARDAFVVGLCAGTAALLKPTGAIVAIAFGLATLTYARNWRIVFKHGICGLIGALIPIGVATTYLIAADNLRDMPALSRQISSYAANSAWDWADLVKPLIVVVIAGFPFLVRGVIFRRESLISNFKSDNRAVWMFLLTWLILESIGVIAQRRMYAYHFMVLAPALALLFGALPRRARVGPLTAALAPLALFSLYGGTLTIQLGRNAPTLAASDYLKMRAQPTDKVWKDDAARLLLETGLRCGSRFPLTFLFANTDIAPLEYTDQILRDFQQNQPEYIVLRSDLDGYIKHQRNNILELERFPKRSENFQRAWDRIASYVKENYLVEATVDRQDIWRRIDRRDAPTASLDQAP